MTCNCNGESPCQCGQTADNKTPSPANLTAGNGIKINNVLIGPGNEDYGRNTFSTSTYVYDPFYPKTVVDVQVTPETIEITYIKRAMYSLTTYNNISIGNSYDVANPDIVFKEIYGVKDGKLTLLNTVIGKIIPPKLEETYEFPE